jgi:SAM-dependent methyltransferase
MLSPENDAYGRLIYDHHRGLPSAEIIQRDDGWLGVSSGAPAYFAPYEQWPRHQQRAIRYASGRVLDVGCGAGRVSLHLQAEGHQVVAIDSSPLAVRTCRLRGVRDARVLPITRAGRELGQFDTVIMFGNNFGLFGNPRRARWLLRRFRTMTSPEARILAESRDPNVDATADHRRYHARNRERGRLAGQIRIRVCYGRSRTPWFEYLIVSPREMRTIVAGTGWRVSRLVPSAGPTYVAVLEKVGRTGRPASARSRGR